MSTRYGEDQLNQRDSKRTRLFGSSMNFEDETGKRSSPYQSSTHLDYSQDRLAQLESQSEEQVGIMAEKLRSLKTLSLKMGDEIRGSNKTLDQLGDSFDTTSLKLKNTFSNMMEMAKRSRISIKTWLLIFALVILVFFWVWIT
ncbi:Bet1p NDAI_0B01080 [Naumovozyma dairenensis CBS 421]|uniref:t-SNARE coiled-coil homology domain-containing protein n=1 Tax=Naumovozyma dairenensis (strain ATCC 10597 / BCRC 20456 / CBS 421 / NBRC 0211 / NRRL Y-12639) TaxID=1071378 RepID=G0W5T1_NAUDC|nr:hypothetical protein NDAI_0B01080 [Naumovozyma dairenensis CBS 421]CCD23142.1 hypothetical protein NDAI_0B01080 [Naumovozyma dairenensis CBS 421]